MTSYTVLTRRNILVTFFINLKKDITNKNKDIINKDNKKLVKAGTVVALIAAMGGSFLAGCAKKRKRSQRSLLQMMEL